MSRAGYGILALLGLVAGWIGVTFNRFVRRHNMTREAWSGVEVQLKRRHDLIPPLVACVKAYQDYEASVFETLALARANARTLKEVSKTGQVETGVTRTLRTLLAVAEAYPDLKASLNFQKLSTALVDAEDQLQYARRYYNGSVRDYTILAESFPSRFVARLFGFRPKEYFEVESSIERQAVEVRL